MATTTLVPTSDTSNSNWAASAGSDMFAMIDETVAAADDGAGAGTRITTSVAGTATLNGALSDVASDFFISTALAVNYRIKQAGRVDDSLFWQALLVFEGNIYVSLISTDVSTSYTTLTKSVTTALPATDLNAATYQVSYQKTASGMADVVTASVDAMDVVVTYDAKTGTVASKKVGASADDASQSTAGAVTLTGTTMESNHVDEWLGWRFQNVTVPQGATINRAVLSVLVSTNGADEPKHDLWGEDADSPTEFTTGASDISGRTPTTATVFWDSADLAVDTAEWRAWPNVTDIVQEIVDRAGFASGNAMAFKARQQSPTDSNRDLGVRTWNFSGNWCGAWLVIDYTAVSAAITGTATASITEADVVAGGKTIIITLTGDTFVASGATFDAIRQDIIDGLDSAQSEATGWNAEVRDNEVVGAVARTSDTVVTVTLTAAAAYDITAQETITVTVPATAVSGSSAIVGSPTFTVSTVGGATVRDLIGAGFIPFARS